MKMRIKLQSNFIKRSTGEPTARYIKYLSHRQKLYYGFTLLEILIAIFILGIVMTSILGTFTGIISGSRLVENKMELYQTGRTLIDLISTDIRGIFQQPAEENGLFFIGSEESVEGESMSRMDFITTNSLQFGNKKSHFMTEVGYRIRENDRGDLHSLWRRSQSPSVPPYREGGREVPVCRIVEKLELEFLTKHGKHKILINEIPVGVIISLSLSQDGERETFQTMVRPMVTM